MPVYYYMQVIIEFLSFKHPCHSAFKSYCQENLYKQGVLKCMNIPLSINSDFERVLIKFRDITEGNIVTFEDKEIAEFLMQAKGRFSTWKSFLNSNYLKSIKKSPQLPDYFCDMVKRCLPENGNGSWNGMERQESNLCSQYIKLIDAFIDILDFNHFIFPDYDNVKELLHEYVDHTSTKHISGMGTLLATSILFVFDENHFMVLDEPVKTYFNVNDDKDGIDNYDKIISYSQQLAAKYKLSMWMMNKAYAVYAHGNSIKVGDFNQPRIPSKYIKI